MCISNEIAKSIQLFVGCYCESEKSAMLIKITFFSINEFPARMTPIS